MSENRKIWDKFSRPPETALKKIFAGRLKGKTDISPQWRLQAMTEAFGPVGVGWRYTIDRLWNEPGHGDIVFAFAQVSVYICIDGKWSEAIPGIGGNKLIDEESKGPHSNDEGYKMAVTDALSVAMKALGVAADIYAGMWDGDKYVTEEKPVEPPAEAQGWIDAINQCDSMDDLDAVGENLKNESPAVQNAVRPEYAKRKKALKELVS